jgi:tetratricopeptide (TPR) repeat protein
MKTFGKGLRRSLPALGLGFLSAFGVASVTAISVPAAIAQQVKAKKEFVDNINAASAALSGKRFGEAISKADAASGYAEGAAQRGAVDQIKVAAYCGQNSHQQCITAIAKAKATGGLPQSVIKNYDLMLAGKYEALGQSAKALAQTKANIDKYGGSAAQLSYIARKELDAKNYAEAVRLAQKAADAKGGATAYNIMLNAYSAQGKMDDYYKVVERIAPILNQEVYWRMLIERAKKEPKFKSQQGLLGVYRALSGAGVKLNTQEQKEMGEMALNRGLAIEAEKIWAPLFKAGTLGGTNDKDAERNKRLYDLAVTDAKTNKTTELAKREADAATKATGDAYSATAESWLGAGDFPKAIDLFQKAIAKGNMDAGATDFVKLRLGIAQFKAGKKVDATKTWRSIKSDNGSAWLAKSWLAISKA